jgi:hypothetical protein
LKKNEKALLPSAPLDPGKKGIPLQELAPRRRWVNFSIMSTVAEIRKAIDELSPEERDQLRRSMIEPEPPSPSILQKLRGFAGAARNLPPDLAANHDHYLHGTVKRPIS